MFMFHRLNCAHSLRGLRTHLQRGGLVAYPTESCYGIGALPRHAHAIRAVLQIKNRPQHKGLIVIGADLAQLQPLLCRLPAHEWHKICAQWPAPKTLILPANKRLLPQLRGKRRNKLAVRIPDHQVARRLCQVAGSALISTSCNRAGSRACKTEREVRRQFGRNVWIIRGCIGNRRQPSDIIDWFAQKQLR